MYDNLNARYAVTRDEEIARNAAHPAQLHARELRARRRARRRRREL